MIPHGIVKVHLDDEIFTHENDYKKIEIDSNQDLQPPVFTYIVDENLKRIKIYSFVF